MATLAGGAAGARAGARRTPRTRRAEAIDAPARNGSFGHVSRMLLVGLILLTVAFFGLMQVLQTSQVATTGFEMRALQTERATLGAEIRLLEASIAEQSQLERVRDEATTRLGMVEPETTLRVSVDEHSPAVVPLPRRYVEPVEATEVEEAAWWEPLIERLPGFD
jgi:cell division protein FtsL